MKWALVDNENIVINIVESQRNGEDVQGIDGLTAMQIQDWVNIGDAIDKPEPIQPPEPTAEELKAIRNESMSKDLTLKACWSIEKKTRPGLIFSNYLDELESITVQVD